MRSSSVQSITSKTSSSTFATSQSEYEATPGPMKIKQETTKDSATDEVLLIGEEEDPSTAAVTLSEKERQTIEV